MQTDESILALVEELIAYKKSVVGSEVPYPPPTLQVEAAGVIKQLMQERDDADRRSGSAERKLASIQDTLDGLVASRRKMKQEAGFGDNVSFDVVWTDVLAKSKQAQVVT